MPNDGDDGNRQNSRDPHLPRGDHDIIRLMLREYLEIEPDRRICGEAPAGEAALDEVEAATPDLALIDVALPSMSGLELAQRLQKDSPDLPLVMLSGQGERA